MRRLTSLPCIRTRAPAFVAALTAAFLLSSEVFAACPGNTFYWKNTSTSTWNTAANWSNTLGGAACSNVPFSSATVVFDGGGGGGGCNINIAINVSSLVINANFLGTIATQNNNVSISSNFVQNAGTFNVGSSSVSVKGSWTEAGGNFNAGSSSVTFTSLAAGLSIKSNGKPFFQTIFNGVGGDWVLQDSMTVLSTMTLTNGTLETNSASSFPLAIGGPWLNQTAGRFLVYHSTVTFTATAGQQITSRGSPFDTVILNGTGGAWTLIDSMTITNDLQLVAGTLVSKPVGASQAILLNGDWINSGGGFTANGSTVTLNSAVNQRITTRGFPFNRVTILGGGYWTMVDSMTVSTITVNSASTFDDGGFGMNVSSLSIMGTFVVRGTENILKPPTLPAGSTVTYTAPSGAPVVFSTWTYRNLVINGTASTFSIVGGSLTVVENLTLQNGTLDTTSANNFALIVSGNWLNSGGGFKANGSTVTFAGTTNQQITSRGSPFGNVLFNGTNGVWVLQDSMTVTSTMTLTAGTLDTNATSNFGLAVGGSWFNTAAAARFAANQSMVTFYGTNVGQKITTRAFPFNDLTFNGTGGYWTLQDSMTVLGDMAITAGTLDTKSGTNLAIWAAGSWTNSGGNFLPNLSTVTFAATSTGQTITSGGDNFAYVQFNGSGGYWTLQDSMTLSTMTLTAGTLDSAANDAALVVNGGSWLNNGGTYVGSGSTVTFTSTSGQKITSRGSPWDSLVFNGGGGSWVMQDSMTIQNNLTLTAGTLNTNAASSFPMLLGGNWSTTAAGVFVTNQSTVTFTGSGGQNINGPGGENFWILIDSNSSSGGVVFASSFTANSLTMNSALLSDATMYFNAGSTFTLVNLTWTGSSGNRLTVRSTTDGQSWILRSTGTQTVSFVNAKDSDARQGDQINATNSTNLLNNLNWNFGGAGLLRTWLGGTNTNWFLGSNWDTGVPASQDSALILGSGSFMPTFNAAVSVSTLTLNVGSSVTLAGFSLTVSSLTNQGMLIFNGNEAINTVPDNQTGSTVTYVGAATEPVLSTWTYENLWFHGTGGTFNLTGPITVNEALTITAGTLDATASNYAIGISSSWTNNGGNFTARSSTVTFSGSAVGMGITSRGFPFAFAVLNAPGAYYTLQDSMTLTSDLTLTNGSLDTKSGSNLGMIIGGSWNNQGVTFVANLSTVTFTSTSTGKIIASNAQPFNNIVLNGSGGYWTLQDSMTVSTITITAGTLDTNSTNNLPMAVAGDWMNTAGNFLPNQSLVTFNATTNTKIKSNAKNFNNVLFNGTGSWVMQDSMTLLGDLTLTAGTLDPSANNLAITVGGDWLNNGGAFTARSSTITFNSTSNQSITSRGFPFTTTVFSGSGGYWTLQDSMTVSTITIAVGSLDTNPSSSFGVAVNRDWFNTGGNFFPNASTTVFNATSTNNKIRSGGDNFNNVWINGAGGTWVLQSSMTLVSTLTVTAGTLSVPATSSGMVVGGSWVNNGGGVTLASTVTFNATSVGMTVRSRGFPFTSVFVGSNSAGGYYSQIDSMTVSTITINANNTFDLNTQPIQVTNISNFGTFALHGTEKITAAVIGQTGSTVLYNSPTTSVVLSTWTYRNLTLNGAGTYSQTGALTVKENLTLSAGTLDPTAANNYGTTLTGDWLNNGGAFTARSSTITFNSTTNQDITSNGSTFANVVFNGTNGHWTLQDDMAVSTITLTAGTLDTNSAQNNNITVSREWVNTTGGFIGNQSTVTFTATTTNNRVKSGGDNFSSVQFNGTGGSWILQDSMTVVNDVTLTAGTLDTKAASSFPILLGGDWTAAATTSLFNVNQSTVTFIGNASQRILNSGQAFWVLIDSNTSSGGVIFASSFTATSLTINAAALPGATTAYFNAGSTVTITTVKFLGSAANPITLRPSPTNNTWLIKNTSTNTINFVDVAYSSASTNGGVVMVGGPNSNDSGNNTNWTFKILSVALAPATYDFTSVNLGASTQSVSAITVTNGGNTTETYSLSVTTTGATTWGVGIATPTVMDRFVLEGMFNTVQPNKSNFVSVDVITSTPTISAANIYNGNQSGVSAAIGAVKNLWLNLFMPNSSSVTTQQSMSLAVSASSP